MMVSFPFEKERNHRKKTKGCNNGKSFVSSNVIIGKIIFLSHVHGKPLQTTETCESSKYHMDGEVERLPF